MTSGRRPPARRPARGFSATRPGLDARWLALVAFFVLASHAAAARGAGPADAPAGAPSGPAPPIVTNPFATGEPLSSAAAKFAELNERASTAPPPLSPADAARALARVRQVVLVRHGEHAHLDGGGTPCLSEVGVARSDTLARNWTPHPPPGVEARVDAVLAMNGTGGDPPSVRPVDSAVPTVVAWRVPPARFVRTWGQWDSLAAARSVLDQGRQGAGGSAVLVVWFHWGSVSILNALGIPTTGWNAQSLDTPTTEAYDAAVVLTPHGSPRTVPGPNGTEVVLPEPDNPRSGVRVRIFRTPPINHATLLPPPLAGPGSDRADRETAFFDETVPWAVVARQAGHVVRIVPIAETTGGAVGGKAPVVVERKNAPGQSSGER